MKLKYGLFVSIALLFVATLFAGESEVTNLYDFKVDVKAEKDKKSGKIVIDISPKNGGEVHKDTPLNIKLQTEGKVTLSKSALSLKDAKEPRIPHPVFEVGYKAECGGGKLKVDALFFICTETTCNRVKEKVEARIDTGC